MGVAVATITCNKVTRRAGAMIRPRRDDVATLRARLDADEWLLPGEVGELFGKSRFTVRNWLNAGKLGYRRTPGNQRECNPEDVRRLLAEYGKIRQGIEPKEDADPIQD
jgi:hypothetical protein